MRTIVLRIETEDDAKALEAAMADRGYVFTSWGVTYASYPPLGTDVYKLERVPLYIAVNRQYDETIRELARKYKPREPRLTPQERYEDL